MKNIKVVITKEQLNTGEVIEINSYIAVSGNYDVSNKVETKIGYPSFIYIDNSTGTDLLWNTISNAMEYSDYESFPEQFALIPLKNSKILQSPEKIPRCYKFLVQKNPSSSNATSDLEVYFMNYT